MGRYMILTLGSSKLNIVVHEDEWTQLYLKKNNETIYLGGDIKEIIIPRLLGMLTDFNQAKSGVLCGVDVRWVLSLGERHHVLYASYKMQDGSIKVFWQDADHSGKIIDESVLDVDCQTVLIKSLKSEQIV